MTPIRLVRMAWAGAVVGAVSGFLYLAYAPIANSHATDTLLAEIKVERLVQARRSEVAAVEMPLEAKVAERVTAGGG